MHYRLQWSNHIQAKGLRKEDEKPIHVPMKYDILYLYFILGVTVQNVFIMA